MEDGAEWNTTCLLSRGCGCGRRHGWWCVEVRGRENGGKKDMAKAKMAGR